MAVEWGKEGRDRREIRRQRTEERRKNCELRISKLRTRPKGGSPEDNCEFKNKAEVRNSLVGAAFQPRSCDFYDFYDLTFRLFDYLTT